jgi:hypothetical protein
MRRKRQFGIAIAASLSLSALAFAAAAHGKPFVICHWHGCSFLPAYDQPPNSIPI